MASSSCSSSSETAGQIPVVLSTANHLEQLLRSVPFFPARDALPAYLHAYVDWWLALLHENPAHLVIETSLIVIIIYIALFKRPKKEVDPSMDALVLKERLAVFRPEPLVPALTTEAKMVLRDKVVLADGVSAGATRVRLLENEDQEVINFASTDFLAYGASREVRNEAERTLDKYGVGSCGPRGFYGTTLPHLELEEEITKFFEMEETIVYSDAASTVSSAIAAVAGRTDLLVVDEGVNDNILAGVNLSRAKVIYFKHNDVADLERVLLEVEKQDKTAKRTTKDYRRYIVFEGVYRHYGDVAPLDKIVALKMKYKWSLVCDETLSFGTLGASGKGLIEHFNVRKDAIEILCGALDTTLGSVGGFCVGSYAIVDYQRLSGAGYCFSASAPPFTMACAREALKLMADPSRGPTDLKKLRAKIDTMRRTLAVSPNLRVISDPHSPWMHVVMGDYQDRLEENKACRRVVRMALKKGVLAVATHFSKKPERTRTPHHTIRLCIHVDHSESDLLRAGEILREAVDLVVKTKDVGEDEDEA